ncbi:GAF domain-containing protein [Nostoc sp.]|uniref:GAF domain-containing protein n=1 Tax=Nostoc sp. TaxID=1180 RepID=UPI003FA58625
MTFSLHQNEQQKTLSGVIARIRKSLDIDAIFKITVTEVRQLLKTDRVSVFRFYPDLGWEGEFIHEDVGAEWGSALAAKLRDHCFATEFDGLYQQGRIKAMADIYQASISDCHIQMLDKIPSTCQYSCTPMLQSAPSFENSYSVGKLTEKVNTTCPWAFTKGLKSLISINIHNYRFI